MKRRQDPIGGIDEEVDDAPRQPLTIEEAVATGDYLKILLAQQHEIAQSIPDEKGPAKAALHRQLSIVSKEIGAIEAAEAHSQESDSSVEVNDGEFDAEAI